MIGGAQMPRRARAGFTLIEISLVLLLFASAVGGLLSFFPVGLKLEANAISDAAQTMFGLHILGQIEANAAKIDSLDDWMTESRFRSLVMDGVTAGKDDVRITGLDEKDKSELITGYHTSRAYIRYKLDILPVENPVKFDDKRLRRVVIKVSDRRDGNPDLSTPLSVDLVYRGCVEEVFN